MKLKVIVIILFFILSTTWTVHAEDMLCACKQLPPEKSDIAKEIFESQHPYDCCDKTLTECLKEKKRCRSALRLANQICTMVKKSVPKTMIEKAISDRAKTMLDIGKKANIDLTNASIAGDLKAPVTVTTYLCLTCPFCSKILPDMYDEVTTGKLKGKARLVVKLFPIKGHEGSVEAAFAAMAARQQGKFFPFLLNVYENYMALKTERLPDFARQVALDMNRFSESVKSLETKLAVVNEKKEGVSNGVNATPSFFINGRKYYGKMTRYLLTDIIEEEYDRTTGKILE